MRLHTSVFFLTACAMAAAPQSLHVEYATYLGGSSDEVTSGIAVDSVGNAYVIGTTFSPDFPLSSTAFGVPSKDHGCAFVVKLNATATRLIWSLCLANATGDRIAVDSTGAVYVLTNSVNISSVTRITPDGDKIVYSKSLGTLATALAVDTAGNVYAVGAAYQDFVTTPGAFQTKPAPGTCYGGGAGNIPGPCPDAFAIKLRIDGSVAYATYLGGSGSTKPVRSQSIPKETCGSQAIPNHRISPPLQAPWTPDSTARLISARRTSGMHSLPSWIPPAAPCFIPRTSADRRQMRASPLL